MREGRAGLAFVVAAPSGTGKTTICRAVVDRDPAIVVSISHTTRKPRAGEEDGVHYRFVDAKSFRELVNAGGFLEHADYGGNLYGTSHEALRVPMEEQGLDVLLEIEVQGAEQIRERKTGALFIFLLPPSFDELARRLRGRGTDDEETIEKRLALADRELAAIDHFDYAVVNDDLETAIQAVSEIIQAERRGDPAELSKLRERQGREAVFRTWLASNPKAAAGA